MADLSEQIRETWRINNDVNLLIIDHLPEAAFAATLSQRGGRDIARQLAHMHNVRVPRLAAFAKRQGAKLGEFAKGESPKRRVLRQAFELSGSLMSGYLLEVAAAGGAVANFQRGVIPMLGYYISHEAHHRGSILLTMKQCGFPIPEKLKWGIWEWNKI